MRRKLYYENCIERLLPFEIVTDFVFPSVAHLLSKSSVKMLQKNILRICNDISVKQLYRHFAALVNINVILHLSFPKPMQLRVFCTHA
jgi:Sec7-like guanine-nucleotide exchange factor